MTLRQCLLVAALACASLCARAEPLIVGYFPFWASYSHGASLADVPAEKLTHLIYAVGKLGPDGSVAPGDFFSDLVRVYTGDDKQLYRGNYALIPLLKARNPKLKVLLSVGGWNWSRWFSDVAADPAKRTRFVTTALALMDQYGFDGLELDWRFPVVGGPPETGKRPDDLANYQLLLHVLRQACDQQRRASCQIAMTVSPVPWTRPSWPSAAMVKDVDFVSVIASDFQGAWSKTTGHKSPLRDDPAHPGPSIASAVSQMTAAGLPARKLVLILPAQGMSWLGVPPQNQGLYQPFKGVSVGTWDTEQSAPSGVFTYGEIVNLVARGGFESYWDSVAQAESLYAPRTGQLISYESPRAFAAKLDYIQQQHLAGVALWEISSDAPGDLALLEQGWRYFHPWRARWAAMLSHTTATLPWLVAILAGVVLALLVLWQWQRRRRWQAERLRYEKVVVTLRELPAGLQAVAQGAVQLLPCLPDPRDVAAVRQLQALATSSLAIHHQILPLAQLEHADITGAESALAEPVTNACGALLGLERFTRELAEQRSLERMLDTMLRFLADDPRVSEAVLLEEEGEAASVPDEVLHLDQSRTAALLRHGTFADYGLALRFHSALSDEDAVYFRTLANQVVLVRQQLHELARQPQLLSELYEIASRRDKLHYIRADRGYSGIYAADLTAPHYVTLRLRAIRLYFDELVQVHRSYLVRPKAVTGSRRAAGGGVELIVAGQSVPVARTYLGQLRRQYPAWFKAEAPAAACSS